MRIAFTHNMQLEACEEQAEYDTPATVAAIRDALASLGHEVVPIDVAGSPARLVARLESLSPDLVFNTAEGSGGPFREAFYPALFEQLRLPFTGSDAYVCALTLDKHLTKKMLEDHGVPMPRSAVLRAPKDLSTLDLIFPIIVKPNFEGSSKGITQDSVFRDRDSLKARIGALLLEYPDGLLAEEFIVGVDIVVPFIEGAPNGVEGVLEPASYTFDGQPMNGEAIYDFSKKNLDSDRVDVHVPAAIPEASREEAKRLAAIIFRVLGVRDAARIDMRVAGDGTPYFIEINALPSLEPGAALYEAARLAGLPTMKDVIGAMVDTASRRFAIAPRASRRRVTQPVRVGLAFNLKGQGDGVSDAEYDSRETIDAIAAALRSHGHEVVELEATSDLLVELPSSRVDVVFNIAEGLAGRNRESHVPAVLELLGVPYSGSDPTTLGITLDKVLAKRLVQQAGLETAPFFVMRTGKEPVPTGFTFPAIIKPAAEGSSKGIVEASVVEDEAELRELAASMCRDFRQDLLVEAFLPGREFTVGLLGERRPRALPIMEIVLPADHKFPTYSYARKFEGKEVLLQVPAQIPRALDRELKRVARTAFVALGCRDVGRVDLRLDAAGKVNFIECNPLPGLSPGFSDLCLIADAAGIPYQDLIQQILAPALRRMRAQRRSEVLV